jgi:hypothetical protein
MHPSFLLELTCRIPTHYLVWWSRRHRRPSQCPPRPISHSRIGTVRISTPDFATDFALVSGTIPDIAAKQTAPTQPDTRDDPFGPDRHRPLNDPLFPDDPERRSDRERHQPRPPVPDDPH